MKKTFFIILLTFLLAAIFVVYCIMMSGKLEKWTGTLVIDGALCRVVDSTDGSTRVHLKNNFCQENAKYNNRIISVEGERVSCDAIQQGASIIGACAIISRFQE